MIMFVGFILSFGPLTKTILWFLPAGLLIIHIANLLRIMFLFFVAIYMKEYLYFTHKYLFTAMLYVIVFGLWVWWVKKYSIRKRVNA
jgi:exosortase/archaeosortase family protein